MGGWMRRMARVWLAALAAMVLLAAGPALPQKADTLTVGIYSLTQHKGHPYKGGGPPHIYVHHALFDALTVLAPGGEPQPQLALSWENVAPDRWRFRLREGVTFSNGEAFDSAAVKAVFDWLATKPGRASFAGAQMDIIKEVVPVDPLTVEFVTVGPEPVFPNKVASIYMVAPKAWAEKGENGFADDPAGTGAYRVKDWRPGEVTLEAFEGSWRKPKVKTIRIVELPEETARVQAIQSRQIDISLPISPDSVPAVELAGGSVFKQVSPTVMSLALITEKEGSPFKDKRVRQAVNYAVDKQIVAEVLLAGLTKAAGQPVTPIAAGYNPDVAPYPYDPAKAKALLAEAGYKDGFSFLAEIVVGSLPADADIFTKVAQDLEAVGVKAEFRIITFPDWLRRFFAGNWEGQAFGMSYFATPAMTAVNALKNYSCAKEPPPPHICLKEMMPPMEAADREFDPVKREAMMRDLMRMANEEALSLFLVEGIDLVGLGPRVKNFDMPIRRVLWERVELGR